MILLTSSDYIKAHSGLNNNTYDKMILPALERAQDIELTEILGECLVQSLQEKVGDGSIEQPENALYKVLIDNYIQQYLTYVVLSNLTLELGQVMGNGGIDYLTDEHRQSLTFDERGQVKDYWKHQADGYCNKMQKFLKNNSTAFPELAGCSCSTGPTLNSSASSGIWLGGPRGKAAVPKFWRAEK